MSAATPAAANTTVFVRNLPYSWNDRDFERCFEHIGPIKRAFVVTTKGAKKGAAAQLTDDGGVASATAAPVSAGESRGFGFIEFSLPADALRAVEDLNGREPPGVEGGSKKPLAVEISVKKGEKPATAAVGAAKKDAPASASAHVPTAAAAPAPKPAAKVSKGVAVKDLKLDAASVRAVKDAAAKHASDSETSDDEEGEKPKRKVADKASVPAAVTATAKPATAPPVPAAAKSAKAAAAAPGAAPAHTPTRPATAAAAAPAASSSSSSSAPAAPGSSRTMLLSGINPTVKNLREHLKGLADNLETLLYPSPESTLKYKAARLTFADEKLAAAAAKLLDKKLIKGDPVRAILLQNESKSNRLIIRNLPWLVGEKRIHLIFRDCCKPVSEGGGGGTIVQIDLPKAEDGKSKGFGFISFSSLPAAELALKKTGTILNQRPIAVDWALSKDDYVNRVALNAQEEKKAATKAESKAEAKTKKATTTKSESAAAVKEEPEVKVKQEEGAEDADMLDLEKDKRKNKSILDSILGKGEEEDEEDEHDRAAVKTKAAVAAAKKQTSTPSVKSESMSDDESESGYEDEDESMDDKSGEDEDGSDDSDSQAESEDDHDDDAINMSGSDDDDDDDASGSSDDEEEHAEESKDQDPDDAASKRARALASKPSDTVKGCTVFIRNLAYDTREQNLLDKFRQFGEINYAKIVWDRELDRSKGTGFVQFKDPEVAKRVVGMSVDSSTTPAALYKKNRITAAVKAGTGITLDGRVLNIALAVDRESASTLQEKNKEKSNQDKRNLYLANEGNIRADSEAAKSLPAAELEKREKSFREKKKKLKNPNYCVSRTRLSVRNLPLDCDEKIMKRVFLKAARDAIKEQPKDSPVRDGTIGQPVVRQVKLLRATDRFDSKGEGRSKRYGFLEFEHHEHSLLALRRLNNNPDAFADSEGVSKGGRHVRPFVEFALEDVRKLLIRTQKLAAALKRKALKEKQQAELEAIEGAKAKLEKPKIKSSEQPTKKPPKPVVNAADGGGRGACFKCGLGGRQNTHTCRHTMHTHTG